MPETKGLNDFYIENTENWEDDDDYHKNEQTSLLLQENPNNNNQFPTIFNDSKKKRFKMRPSKNLKSANVIKSFTFIYKLHPFHFFHFTHFRH